MERQQPDVLVIDVALLGMNGLAATREVKRRAPRTPVLLVADWGRERDALEALIAGAAGSRSRPTGPTSCWWPSGGRPRPALRGPRLPPIQRLEAVRLARAKRPAFSSDVLRALSPREREVFDLVVRGWRNAIISQELGISIKTVDTHRTRIHRKLGCRSGAELIRFAAENDLLRRRAGSPDDRPARTVLLLVDDDAQVRAEILRNVLGEGWRQIRTCSASEALTELRSSQEPCLVILDGDGAQPDLGEIYRQILREDPLLAKNPVVAAIEGAGRQPAVRAAVSLP